MKTRYRLGYEGVLFKKPVLVLQIFKHFPDGPDDAHGMPGYLAYDAWVDATVEDMVELSKVNN